MNRLLTLTQTFLTGLWKFFQLPFPATNVSIGAIVIFPVVVSITVAFIKSLFGIGGFAQLSGSAYNFSNIARSKRQGISQANKRLGSK